MVVAEVERKMLIPVLEKAKVAEEVLRAKQKKTSYALKMKLNDIMNRMKFLIELAKNLMQLIS
jgi:hypothetical protein